MLAHDDDLVPLARRCTVAGRFQTLGSLQESVFVAPNEINFQQLQTQIAPIRFALERNAHQVGCLIVQTVRHMKVGLGQGIALIEIDSALAGHRVVGRSLEVRGSLAIALLLRLVEIRHGMLARFLHDE